MDGSQTPFQLALIRDALGQAGLAGGAKVAEGLRVGSTGVPAGPGDLWLENSIRRSAALSAGATGGGMTLAVSPAWQPAALDAERWDTDNLCDLAADATKLTARTGGIYQVFGCFTFAANASGLRGIGIALNGSLLCWHILPALAAGPMGMALQAVWQACENDAFQLMACHNLAAPLGLSDVRFAAARLA